MNASEEKEFKNSNNEQMSMIQMLSFCESYEQYLQVRIIYFFSFSFMLVIHRLMKMIS